MFELGNEVHVVAQVPRLDRDGVALCGGVFSGVEVVTEEGFLLAELVDIYQPLPPRPCGAAPIRTRCRPLTGGCSGVPSSWPAMVS